MILKKNILLEYLTILLIIFLAFTNVFILKFDEISISIYLLYGAFFIALISFFTLKLPIVKESIPLFIIFLYILCSTLLNYEVARYTSVIYSFLFIIYFIYAVYCSKLYLTEKVFIKGLKSILIVFFVVLLLSQVIVLLGMQELQGSNGYFQSSGQFGIMYNKFTNQYRFQSLSSEPSYAAIIVLSTYAILERHLKNKMALYLFGAILLYMIISFRSSIGLLILGMWAFSQITFSKKHFLILGLLIFIAGTLFFFTNIGGRSVNRIREIVFLFFSFDEFFIQNLNIIDSSAYARIGPFFIYLQQLDLFDYHTYFGFGASSSEYYFSKIFYPESWNTDLTFKAPFLPGFLYDYGFIGVFLVLLFLWILVGKMNIFFKFLLLIILLNSNFNTQIFWFVILLISVSKLYLKNKKEIELQTEFSANQN